MNCDSVHHHEVIKTGYNKLYEQGIKKFKVS